MIGGWFVGDFEPTVFNTSQVEVGFKRYVKGEVHETHYHKISTEINYLVSGSMSIDDSGKILKAGDIFTILPNEIAKPIFYEDCEIVVVKVPASKDDKYVIE
jgi:quercetin dioxygenase-like cupin family protein